MPIRLVKKFIKKDFVDIVMPSYDDDFYTRLAIDSLYRCTTVPFRLIVIDNGSTPEKASYLKKEYEDGRIHVLIRDETNLGFPKAINQGFEYVKSDKFVIANNDIIFSIGWLKKLITALQSRPNVAFSSPLRLERPPGVKDLKFCQFQVDAVPGMIQLSLNEEAPLDILIKQIEKTNRLLEARVSQKVLTKQKFAPFAFILMKSDVYKSLGGMDEDFGVGTHEDVYFCKLLIHKGYDIAIATTCFIYHFMSKSLVRVLGSYDGIIRKINENHKIMLDKLKKQGIPL